MRRPVPALPLPCLSSGLSSLTALRDRHLFFPLESLDNLYLRSLEVGRPFLREDEGEDRKPAPKLQPLPPPPPEKLAIEDQHIESHGHWSVKGREWRHRRQGRRFAGHTLNLDRRAWAEEKAASKNKLRTEGVEFARAKKADGKEEEEEEEEEEEQALPVWPSFKCAGLDAFRSALKKAAPLIRRTIAWSGDHDRLLLRYFKLSCVRDTFELSMIFERRTTTSLTVR